MARTAASHLWGERSETLPVRSVEGARGQHSRGCGAAWVTQGWSAETTNTGGTAADRVIGGGAVVRRACSRGIDPEAHATCAPAAAGSGTTRSTIAAAAAAAGAEHRAHQATRSALATDSARAAGSASTGVATSAAHDRVTG